jgi:hypothetical protein
MSRKRRKRSKGVPVEALIEKIRRWAARELLFDRNTNVDVCKSLGRAAPMCYATNKQ